MGYSCYIMSYNITWYSIHQKKNYKFFYLTCLHSFIYFILLLQLLYLNLSCLHLFIKLILHCVLPPHNTTPHYHNWNGPRHRVIASLHRVMSKEDIAAPVLEALKREFFGMTKSKQQQQYIDGKIRNVRYLAELVKFGVAPPIVAFRMFKTLMADFTPHNIELTAVLLESCGR